MPVYVVVVDCDMTLPTEAKSRAAARSASDARHWCALSSACRAIESTTARAARSAARHRVAVIWSPLFDDPASYASATVLKAFMPNIVMIDFADEHKCDQIYSLNKVAATELTYAARQLRQ